MGERPGVEVLADLADELAVRCEFQELRGGVAIGGAGAAAATRIDKYIALRIPGDAGGLTEVHIGRHLRKFGTESNGICGTLSCAQAGKASGANATLSPNNQRCIIVVLLGFTTSASCDRILPASYLFIPGFDSPFRRDPACATSASRFT
jgi:hypothetical protein